MKVRRVCDDDNYSDNDDDKEEEEVHLSNMKKLSVLETKRGKGRKWPYSKEL